MRQFSTLEKNIVKRLAEWELHLQINPINHFMVTFDALINDISTKYNGQIIFSGMGGFPFVEIHTAHSSTLQNHTFNNQMTRDIINTVNFLDYLSKNELIYFISPNNLMPILFSPATIGVINGTDTRHTNRIGDKSFFEKVEVYFNKEIYPTQTLIDYYNNDYKSDEEIKHIQNLKVAEDSLIETRNGLQISIESLEEARKGLKISEDSLKESKKSIDLASDALIDSQKNLKIAKIALYSALILGIIGTFGSAGEVYYAWVSSKNTDTKIDSMQFQSITKQLDKLNEIETKFNRKDTIITKVINFPKK